MYVEYDEYLELSAKAIDAEEFTRLAFRAGKKIQSFTHSRIDAMATVPEAVKRCETELIDILYAADSVMSGASGAVSSFSNDGYSENYGEAMNSFYFDGLILDTMTDYLAEEYDDRGIPLIYQGVDA